MSDYPADLSTTQSNQQLTRIYTEHKPWLQQWLTYKLGCNQQAADLVQDTFLRLIAKRLAILKEPKAYLRVIANGLLNDQYRRRSIESAYLEALSHAPQNVAMSPEQREILLETLQLIDSELAKLPEKVSQAFFMAQLYGFTYQQIADNQAVSLRTIKRYMQQAYLACLTVII
ncbi:MAG: sigma-70 family RNA polymerase sigma factor [Gammaproteobacteria bacterium]|nr:sigma-70 family RNA polymerase sigma factor [Gammaproteobacteria bacterium]